MDVVAKTTVSAEAVEGTEAMMEALDTDIAALNGVWTQVLEIRRLARRIPAPEISLHFSELADHIEHGARKLSQKLPR
jgi:hypothetical protein